MILASKSMKILFYAFGIRKLPACFLNEQTTKSIFIMH
jgi:hypothetical protein